MKKYRLAILVDPLEKTPPSNLSALNKFVEAGNKKGLDVNFISKNDISRLPEFDALFIRETTKKDNHTFKFSMSGALSGLIVIDEFESIIACTDKTMLAEIFRIYKIPSPKTIIIYKNNIEAALIIFSFPFVLKLPDSDFSKGVIKVEDKADYYEKVNSFLKKSKCIVAQEYLYTDFDWRIGVLDKKLLFACKYYMAENYWKVINWNDNQTSITHMGKVETVDLEKVPQIVIDTAIQASSLIGDGLYGVDLKEIDGKIYVIEVNDNPNIDAGNEDLILGDELYNTIMEVFLNRIKRLYIN